MKLKFVAPITLALCFFTTSLVLAQRDLSIEYPDIPGATTPRTTNILLSDYLDYIYTFAIFIAGALSFVISVWGGIKYITSTGQPYKIKIAKKQIESGLLGLLIILSSYLILNTINPDLVRISIPFLTTRDTEIIPPSAASLPPLQNQEIPVGTLITSEITLSSFVVATETDPRIDITDKDDNPIYNSYFDEITTKYPTDYQGGLDGRRLKRIHEVASTSILATTFLRELYGDLLSATEELGKKIDKLNLLSQGCGCQNCGDKNGCTGNGICLCDCLCEGDFCLDEDKMNKLLKEIPSYYEEPDSLLQCKLAHVEYYSRAFEAFLRDDGYLVKSDEDDYQDNSYWYSNRADELRGQIEDCISNGMIEQEQYDDDDPDNDHWSTEEIIALMASVENKGTYSPKTEPFERDIETNLKQLQAIITYLDFSKALLNPEDPVGCFPQVYSYLQFPQIADSLHLSPQEIETVPMGDIRVREDPATFYCPIYPVDYSRETMLLEDIVGEETACAPIVEIPIGNTIDEALELMDHVAKELKNIFNQGIEMHNRTIETTDEEEGLAVEMFEKIGSFLNSIKKLMSYNCSDACYSECDTLTYTDAQGKAHCSCFCSPCQSNDSLISLKKEINQVYADIKSLQGRIRSYYYFMQSAEQSIYDSFYKLHGKYPEKDPLHPSGHPKAGEKVPIGEDICCEAPEGYCRDKNNKLIMGDGMAEKKDYTLKDKLIEIQKLLNKSRDFGTYRILLEQLIEMNLAKKEELYNLTKNTDALLDLSNCDVLISQLAEQAGAQFSGKILESCWLAKSENFNHIVAEKCSSDPPYDCDYFNPLVEEKKSHLLCYCYEQAFYEDIASNFFCCNIKD